MTSRNFTRAMLVVAAASLLGLLVSLAAKADSLPTAKVTNKHRFEDFDTAARAALAVSLELSTEHEYGGAVIECAGVYAYTDPVTNNSPIQVNYHLAVPVGCRPVALYHTHPGNTRDAHMLSSTDMKTARRLGVPSYILVVRTRQVSAYTLVDL